MVKMVLSCMSPLTQWYGKRQQPPRDRKTWLTFTAFYATIGDICSADGAPPLKKKDSHGGRTGVPTTAAGFYMIYGQIGPLHSLILHMTPIDVDERKNSKICATEQHRGVLIHFEFDQTYSEAIERVQACQFSSSRSSVIMYKHDCYVARKNLKQSPRPASITQ